MTARSVLTALLVLTALTPAAALAEAFWSGAEGAETVGRAGTDAAVPGEATALQSNPAALAALRRNRSDISISALFRKLDFSTRNPSTRYNGDQAYFGTTWAYAFMPSHLSTDPFREWALLTERAKDTFEARSRYEGRLAGTVSAPPGKVEILSSGVGFWVSDVVLRGRARAERGRTRFLPPPLPEVGLVTACQAEFEYRLTALEKKAFPAPSLTLSAYGQHESVLLKGEPGPWHSGKVAMAVGNTRLPADASFTAVCQGVKVELRRVVFQRTAGLAPDRLEERTPVPDEALTAEEDAGDARIVLASAPGPFQATTEESSLWSLEDPDRFKGEELTGLVIEFRYGFEGKAARGTLSLLADGKQIARRSFDPEPVTPPADAELDQRRRAVDWIERDKVHVGIGFFTDAMMAAGYPDLPSDAGAHEGQIRYGAYSLTLGFAMDLHPAVAVGVSASAVHGRFFNLDGLFSQPAGAVIAPLADDYLVQTGRDRVSLQVETDDLYAWGGTGRAGLLVRPADILAFGASFQGPVALGRHSGRGSADLTDDFLFTGFDAWIASNVALPVAGDTGFGAEYDVAITGMKLPLRAALGASVLLGGSVTLAVEGEFIGWTKALEHLTLKFTRGSNLNADAVTGSTFQARIPMAFKDQWAASVGLSAVLHPAATLHAGYRWNSSPVRESAAHPIFPAHVQHSASLGLSLSHRGIGIHLAVQHGFDAVLRIARSAHGSLLDGSRFAIREETAVLGISYEY